MRRSRNRLIHARKTIALVVDGHTEYWYFNMLKRNERDLALNIEPRIPQKKSLQDQYNLVVSLTQQEYDKVYWIVDLDTVLKETRETPKGKTSALELFLKLQQRLKKNLTNVEVFVNNPCLEFWFLLHFVKTSKRFDNCSDAEKQLRRFIPDYEKTQRYFTKQDHDIYLKLKPHLSTAKENAKLLQSFDEQNASRTVSEIWRIFETWVD